jgi:ribosomal protein S18 acetylase RimI-like enzyme
MTTVLPGDAGHVDGAARVWAEATAARDGHPGVAPLESSRPVISEVFAQPGATLIVAVDDDGQVVAFAVAAPIPAGAMGSLAPKAEVRYAGVRPGRWGQGLAGRVLRRLCAELAAAGFAEVELMVYLDNTRAVAIYRHLGWEQAGPAVPHRRTGKPEQRYRLRLLVTGSPGG